MRRLDSAALFAAIDQRRSAAGLTWTALAHDTGVSVATIRRLERGGRMEADGLLALVGWLGVPVETFVRDVQG
jgi:transcriptional regulator with XRE-family HTH domain